MDTIGQLLTATLKNESEDTEISSCSVDLPVDRQARRTNWSSVLFQALMSKSWNAVFRLSAIRLHRRGPWGAEVRAGFETEVERVAKGHNWMALSSPE